MVVRGAGGSAGPVRPGATSATAACKAGQSCPAWAGCQVERSVRQTHCIHCMVEEGAWGSPIKSSHVASAARTAAGGASSSAVGVRREWPDAAASMVERGGGRCGQLDSALGGRVGRARTGALSLASELASVSSAAPGISAGAPSSPEVRGLGDELWPVKGCGSESSESSESSVGVWLGGARPAAALSGFRPLLMLRRCGVA